MSLFLFGAKGAPLETQGFTWRDMVQKSISKLDDDAFTRIRIILMYAIAQEALRFSHACARMNRELRTALARVCRVEGKDANNILQCYTDILPGRPTALEHRAPEDDLRDPYHRRETDPLSKLHALTILSAEQQTHSYYMTVGPLFADPVARQLYAEIASIEEQHVTQYESIIDPEQTWLEQWLLHEANEAYLYHSCLKQEANPRIRAIWQRFLDYELGQLKLVMDLFKEHERRDPVPFTSQRAFVRHTLASEVNLRARGPKYVPMEDEGAASQHYREQLNCNGSPSQAVASGYHWRPGTELGGTAANF